MEIETPSNELSMSRKIRLATLEEIPKLQELIAVSVRALSVPYYSKAETESALTHVFGVDTQLILDGTYFVAESIADDTVSESELIGCGGWSKRNTLFGGDQAKYARVDDLLQPGKDSARIRAFYVHPQWARKGIGAMLIQACENAALEAGFRRLELIATLPGEPLYSANGYEIVESYGIPLPDNQSLPGFRMAKNLVEP